MMLVRIEAIASGIVCRRSWCKRIHIPCRRSRFHRVSCPSKRPIMIRIHTSACRLKHLLTRAIATVRSFKLHFKPVQECSAHIIIKTVFPRDSADQNSCNHHSKNSQHESMSPNKPEHFQAGVYTILNLLNCSYLHKCLLFFLTKIRITQKHLKLSKRKGPIGSKLSSVAKWS